MGNKVKTYRPDQVSLSVGGSLITSWDKIRVVKENDDWTFQEGTTGEIARVKNLGKLGMVEVELQQTSSDNDIFSAYQISDSTVLVSVIDKSGKTVAIIPEATIVKPADSEFGKEPTNRVWQAKGGLDVYVVAGN